MSWLAVAAGGALGSLARYAVSVAVARAPVSAVYPVATLIVNAAGCLVIGLLAGLIASNRLALDVTRRDFIFVGLLGGFTTFSTFGLDTLLLARSQAGGLAVLNVAAHLAAGFGAVYIGYVIGSAAR